jgi:hypothetical protein
MKYVTPEDLREVALSLDTSYNYDESCDVYYHMSSNHEDWFTVRPCQNGWHVEFHNNLLGMRRADFCVPTEDIFNIVDKQELISSILEILNRQIRMAQRRVKQLREVKKQLV